MKLRTYLVLSITTIQAAAARIVVSLSEKRTLQQLQEDTVITGTGVTDAEITPETSVIEVPNYDDAQCTTWLQGALEADADSSNGLSESEFHSFLKGIKDVPPYVQEYFAQHADYQSMPWMFKVMHKTLACRCEDLGLGSKCCTGDDPEVQFIGLKDDDQGSGGANLTQEQKDVAREYKADMCNSIAVVLDKFIPTPAPTDSPTDTPTEMEGRAPPAPGGGGDSLEPTSSPTPFEGMVSVVNPVTPQPTMPPTRTTAFECVDATKCNESDPSQNEQASGWDKLGYCGPGMSDSSTATSYYLTTCPPPHDGGGATYYNVQDRVSMVESDVKTRVELNVVGSTIDYSAFDMEDTMAYISAATLAYDAQDVLDNYQENNILKHVLWGFGRVASDILGGDENVLFSNVGDGVTAPGKRRGLLRRGGGGDDDIDWRRGLQIETLGSMDGVKVKDIECPRELMYAPQDKKCLNFKFVIHPDDQNQASVDEKYDYLKYAIDKEGKLYDAVMEMYPDTFIRGLGNPGKGIRWFSLFGQEDDDEGGGGVGVMKSRTDEDGDESKLPWWAILVIALAAAALPVALIAMYVKRKRREDREHMARLAEYESHKNDLEASGQVAPYEVTPDESLGGAPVVVAEARMSAVPEDDEDEESSESSVWSNSEDETGVETQEESKTSSTNAGSALAAMGAAGVVAATLSPNENDEDKAAIEAEIRSLIQETNSPRSADELLAAYAGNELVLLKHLRKARENQVRNGDNNDKEAMKAEIRALVEETKSPCDVGEFLKAYGGKEEVLLDHLRKMKKDQAANSSREFTPVGATAVAMALPAGEVDKEAIRAEIAEIVEECALPLTADKLMEAYAGREEILIAHLRTTRVKQRAEKAEDADGASASVAPAAEPDVAMPSTAAAAATVGGTTAAAMALKGNQHDDEKGSSTSENVSPLPSTGFITPVGEKNEKSLSSDWSADSSSNSSDSESCVSEAVSEEPVVVAPDLISGPMPETSTPGMIDQELLERMSSRKDMGVPEIAAASAAGSATTQVIVDEELAQKMKKRLSTEIV